MTSTVEALAALHAAEADLEVALAAEKPATASVSVSVAPAPVSLGPEQIATAKEFLSRDPPPGPGVDPPTVPPAVEKPKWLVLPGYLGPIAINGS